MPGRPTGDDALAADPFDWQVTKAGRVLVFRGGRQVVAVGGRAGLKLATQLEGVDEAAGDAVEQATGLVSRLEWATTVADADEAFERLAALDEVRGTPGAIGFCFGGGLAFNVAADVAPAVLVSYYGSGLPDLLGLAPQVICSSLHHFGTTDDYIPTDVVRTITEAVTADGRPARVELHEGANHAFDNDDFFLHHPEASARAWQQTLAFLGEQLPV